MPPQSSLPLRDGRVGLPYPSAHNAGSQTHDADYSDDDIRLLEEIVRLGESLYPTLPEQNRLPTNALFKAAEQVLPAYGYDAENPPFHISRLIFKIGGQRSGETLTDKFQAVLAGMNIDLEYIPSSPYRDSPAARSGRSNLVSDDETGGFDFGPRPIPRRRHSSVSRPVEPLSQPEHGSYDLPILPRIRARSVSPTELFASPSDAHDRRYVKPSGSRDQNQWKRDTKDVGVPKINRELDIRHALAPAENLPSRAAARQDDTDEEEEAEHHSQELPAQRFPPQFSLAERLIGFPRGLGNLRRLGGGFDREENKGLRESPLIIPNAHLNRHSPKSEASEGFRGTSDTTVQTQDEQDLLSPHYQQPVDDIDALEAKLRQSKMQDDATLLEEACFVWHAIETETKSDNRELQSRAAEFDDNDMIAEALDIWREVAFLARTERLESRAAAEHEAYVERMEKRAQRVYQILTIQTALAHWQDSARDEADRTAVARRHLVRKRAFDGWRAQHVADESKVTNFILINALQKWGQVSLHHEIRKQVAVRRYYQTLAADSLDAMWKKQKCDLADELRDCRIVYDCLNTWYSRTREAEIANDLAIEVDERLLLDEAVVIWRDETDYLLYTAHNTTIDILTRDCQRTLDDWQEQARLTRLLRKYNTANQDSLQHRLLKKWHAASLEAERNTKLADTVTLESPLEFWKNETNLRIFEADVEFETKQMVLKHWYLEERLAWYSRYTETNIKRQILGHLLSAAHQKRGARIRAEQEADYVLNYRAEADCVDAWLMETDEMWRLRQNANLVRLYRTATPCLDTWREHHRQVITRDAYYGRQADRNAIRGTVSNVLDVWPAIAEHARRERLMNTLRQFRRDYKADLARSCLEQLQSEALHNLNSKHEAHAIHVQQRREDVNDCLEYWLDTARTSQNIAQIAAYAEVEVYCSLWQGHLYDTQEDELRAINYDAAQTLSECWRKWEFQGLQNDSRQRMVAAVQNRNEKRLCRQVLDDWLQTAVPDSAHFDLLQFSTMSRRSVRYQNPLPIRSATPYRAEKQDLLLSFASTSRPRRGAPQSQFAPETPRMPVSQLGFGRAEGPTRFGASSRDLGPMAEFDEEESLLPGVEPNDPGFMSTPTRWTGSARPLGYRPTTTPSAVLPSPYERELRREYGQARPRVEFADIREESLED